jgi:amidohydrolase
VNRDSPSKKDIPSILSTLKPDLSSYESLYKNLHQHPGLSLQEHLAAETAAKHLRQLKGFDVRTKIGGTGLVGILKNGEGKTVLLRADTDALPVKELTGLPYASEVKEVDVEDGIEKPVMHACGHDMHVASLLAAATTVHAAQDSWRGTLIILFQPNEERAGGAKAMIADGLYDPKKHNCPAPDVVLGQHVMPYPAGTVGTRVGAFASAADSFRVTVYGRGGHASQPHMTIDPVVLAAHIIVRLQTVVSREVNPREAAVVTVGSVKAGMTENIIASEAVIKINVRTVTLETREKVLAAIKRIVKAECEASGAPEEPLWESTSSFPFTINDKTVTEKLAEAFTKQFGEKHDPECLPLGGSEDFAILATEAPNKDGGKGVPYSYWRFGGTDPKMFKDLTESGNGDQIPINHSAYFAPVIQPTMSTAVDALVVGALTFLS